MKRKSWHLHRRTFLHGAGASIALPLLEGMSGFASAAKTSAALPKRMCCFYFPFGISQVKPGATHAEWHWFPSGEGKDFKLSKTLAALEPFRENITVMEGLNHRKVQSVPGHDSGDSFLTGVPVKAPNFLNGISLDQFAASFVGDKTRFSNLVFSSDGGVGEPTRTRTISYNAEGRPIPAMSEPEQIFQRLFGVPGEAERLRLERKGSILDRVLDSSRSLERKLGKHDRDKLDEYMSSVRMVEQNIQSSREWLKVAKPTVAPGTVNTNVALDHDPDNFLKTMYDLVFLSLQTDTTRITAYQIGQNLATSLAGNRLPKVVGFTNWHSLGHGQNKAPEKLGKMQEYITGHFARFLQKLADAEEAGGSMLDRTVILHGSTNAATHGTNNYPLILAGGRQLGLRHGQYLRFGNDNRQPCANLFMSMLGAIDVPAKSFADSTGVMSEVL